MIDGDVVAGGVTFHYAEASWGKSRGISIHRVGVQHDDNEYKFNPNPHNADKWYNKHQGDFYATAAQEIANLVTPGGGYPAFGTPITVHKVTYTLDQR